MAFRGRCSCARCDGCAFERQTQRKVCAKCRDKRCRCLTCGQTRKKADTFLTVPPCQCMPGSDFSRYQGPKQVQLPAQRTMPKVLPATGSAKLLQQLLGAAASNDLFNGAIDSAGGGGLYHPGSVFVPEQRAHGRLQGDQLLGAAEAAIKRANLLHHAAPSASSGGGDADSGCDTALSPATAPGRSRTQLLDSTEISTHSKALLYLDGGDETGVFQPPHHQQGYYADPATRHYPHLPNVPPEAKRRKIRPSHPVFKDVSGSSTPLSVFDESVAILFPADPHMLASLHFLDIPVAQAVHVHVHGVF